MVNGANIDFIKSQVRLNCLLGITTLLIELCPPLPPFGFVFGKKSCTSFNT